MENNTSPSQLLEGFLKLSLFLERVAIVEPSMPVKFLSNLLVASNTHTHTLFADRLPSQRWAVSYWQRQIVRKGLQNI